MVSESDEMRQVDTLRGFTVYSMIESVSNDSTINGNKPSLSWHHDFRFRDRKPAVGAYAQVLEPPRSVCDVTYWLNYLSENNDCYKQTSCTKYAAINTAGE